MNRPHFKRIASVFVGSSLVASMLSATAPAYADAGFTPSEEIIVEKLTPSAADYEQNVTFSATVLNQVYFGTPDNTVGTPFPAVDQEVDFVLIQGHDEFPLCQAVHTDKKGVATCKTQITAPVGTYQLQVGPGLVGILPGFPSFGPMVLVGEIPFTVNPAVLGSLPFVGKPDPHDGVGSGVGGPACRPTVDRNSQACKIVPK